MSELPINITTILNEKKQFLDNHAEFPSLHNTIKLNGIGQTTKYTKLISKCN